MKSLIVSKDELRQLREIRPCKLLLNIGLEWSIILSLGYACWSYFNAITYTLTVIIIGSRIHALSILMHEATHFGLCSGIINRKYNDLIANLLICWPIFFNIEDYRANHFLHHRYLRTEKDPDYMSGIDKQEYSFPQTPKNLYKNIAIHFTGIKSPIIIGEMLIRMHKAKKANISSSKPTIHNRHIKIIYYLLIFSALTYFQIWTPYLLLWIIPLATTFQGYFYIRSIAEHSNLPTEGSKNISQSRSTEPSFTEKILIAPYNVSHHLEHHLFPSVPYYNLPKVKKLLQRNNIEKELHYTKGYMRGLVNELTNPLPR